MKKAKKNKINLKRTLQRGVATLSAVAIMAGAGAIASKIYRDVEVPEGFDYSGTSISSNKTLPDEIEGDFVLIEVNSWKEGISKESIKNIKKCNEQGVPCGILLESDATTEQEAIADAACVLALTEGYEIDYPIYYNIDGISTKLSLGDLVKICNSFYVMCKGKEVGISGKVDILNEIKGQLQNGLKLMAISDGNVIENPSEYDTCFFKRTGGCYSTEINSKDNEVSSTQTLIKGIDVSTHQGNIDWKKVNESDVNYAIIRFASFEGFHGTGTFDIDDKFYENVAECIRLGIPYGIYCFTDAKSEAEAKVEAKELINRLEGVIGNNLALPIFYDIEGDWYEAHKKEAGSIAGIFCEEIKRAGYASGIYASESLYNLIYETNPNVAEYYLWIARYGKDKQRPYDTVNEKDISGPDVADMHQVTSNATLPGIDVNTVDTNIANADILNAQANNRKK